MKKMIAAAAAAITLAGASIVPAQAQGKGETVRLQDYPGIGNLLFRVAIAKGFCEQHGITCRLQIIPSGALGAQALLARSIDVAVVGPESQILAMLKGANLAALMSVATANPFQIVVRNEAGVPEVGQDYRAVMTGLKGRKIGVPARGAVGELQFGQLAQRAGLKPEDFVYVAVGGPNTAYGALVSKQVDALMTFEPAGSICEVMKNCRTVFRAARATEPVEVAGTNGASVIAVMTRDAADRAPHVVDALIAAGRDAAGFLQDPKNFDETLRIAQSYFRFDIPRGDEVMAESLRAGIPSYRVEVSRPALKQIADNMLLTKQIDAPFDTSKLLHAKAP
ncbi:MAG: ABC transporter substrate-binding protein [Reyranella sp.]|uniref:ABC transporter substrate-binding protein n=2 Tax=Pseudomonadota TaxID=1224 RepID=UPI001ACF2405|nr:ABC transporter substrate-binding protein [Reyranella sp.]MBN9090484.1 ABC transporter substrate-binding protein [Reyranella sp.]